MSQPELDCNEEHESLYRNGYNSEWQSIYGICTYVRLFCRRENGLMAIPVIRKKFAYIDKILFKWFGNLEFCRIMEQ